MGILSWIVLGGVAGWFASLILGERQGFLSNVIIGIAGAMLAGFFFSRFGGPPVTGLNVWSFLVALAGSLVLVALFRALRGPQVS